MTALLSRLPSPSLVAPTQPAEAKGVQVGDLVLTIDGHSLAGQRIRDVFAERIAAGQWPAARHVLVLLRGAATPPDDACASSAAQLLQTLRTPIEEQQEWLAKAEQLAGGQQAVAVDQMRNSAEARSPLRGGQTPPSQQRSSLRALLPSKRV